MSNKALLSNAELELTQRLQMHFPRGAIPANAIDAWNSCSKEKITNMLKKALGEVPYGGTIITRLCTAGYLDTSFEGKEIHPLEIKPLTKDEALAAYHQSGGKTWIWDELEKNMPYTIPDAKHLDVMIVNFGKGISGDNAVAEMDNLGVRPLTYEELIQYGITNPEHQKQNYLVGLGSKHVLDGDPCAPGLGWVVGGRLLSASHWGGDWGVGCRFPVVRK